MASLIQVSQGRWQQAQNFELDVWKRQNSFYLMRRLLHFLGIRKMRIGDDWNHWWRGQFNGYQVLPSRFDNAIELGCGPYTNIRLIRENRVIDHLFCSDPLASEYIKFRGQWLATEYARGAVLLDNHPVEECPYRDNYFDLVVLVNVLDHVQDAISCLQAAIRITKPSGSFVFGQDLTDEIDLLRTKEDIGHPIRLRLEDIDPLVRGSFDPCLYKILPREEGRNPSAHCGTYLFIGTKCSGGER